jgi:DNA anti-recombination protein RmuC
MKRLGCILVVLIIIIFSGCQQSQQKQGSGISRKDRLIANENMELKGELARCRNEIEKQKKLLEQYQQKPDLKNELAECRGEIEKQKKLLEQYRREIDLKDEPARCRDKIEKQRRLLEQCQQEKEQIAQGTGETEKWLRDELPQNLLEQVEQLTQENEQLKAELARFQVQPPSTPNEMPPPSSPNEPSVN